MFAYVCGLIKDDCICMFVGVGVGVGMGVCIQKRVCVCDWCGEIEIQLCKMPLFALLCFT